MFNIHAAAPVWGAAPNRRGVPTGSTLGSTILQHLPSNRIQWVLWLPNLPSRSGCNRWVFCISFWTFCLFHLAWCLLLSCRTENLKQDHAAVDTLDGAVDALDDHTEMKLPAFCFFYKYAYGHFGTWGGGDFLSRKIYAIPECVIVEIGIQTHSNCTINKVVHNFHITWNREVGDFCGSLISRILDLSGFAGKKSANLDFRLYSWE